MKKVFKTTGVRLYKSKMFDLAGGAGRCGDRIEGQIKAP
jgi:hypothetical protein